MTGIDVILIAVFLFGYCATSLYGYHMFQLNSYKAGVHMRWFLKEKEDFSPSPHGIGVFIGFMLVSIFLKGFTDSIPSFIGLLYGSLCFMSWRKYWDQKTKKPLIYTTRVIRMFATHAIIIVPILVLLLPITETDYYRQLLFLVLLVFFAPLTVILVNFINSPVEWAIRRS